VTGTPFALRVPWSTRVALRRYSIPAALTALTAFSLYLRSRQLGAGYWIDEGISVGIAHHHWSSIPGLLGQDGSPPAYYMLLGLWIRLFGDGASATHTLSLLFGLACVPLSFLAGRALFDRRTGLVCAVLAALDPFLTYYAQESRMYELEAFLSLVVAYAYVQGILRGRLLWAVVLVAGVDLMVYTHNWALFLCVGLAVTTAVVARERLRLFAICAAAVAVLYLPWVPTFLGQVRHTGAPWSSTPSFHSLLLAPGAALSGDTAFIAFVLAACAGLVTYVRRERSEERTIVAALALIVGVTVAVAWISSQISPAWTSRYFAVIVGPMLLLAARAVVRGRRVGLVAFVIVLFLWVGYSVKEDKEDARQVTARLARSLHPGELVVSTHPEQVPVLRYYLGPEFHYATTIGAVPDSRIFDWRDAVDRLRASSMRLRVDAAVAATPHGAEFVVISPVFRDYRAWNAKWTRLVWKRSSAYTGLLQRDPRVVLVRHVVIDEVAAKHNYFKPIQAFVYRRR
jgi:mannosyltransferase